MTAKIFKSLCGNSRRWNTDHVAQTMVQGSPLYIVCDGVSLEPECGQLVRAFCREVCSQKYSFGAEVPAIAQSLRDRFSRAAASLKNAGLGDYSFCVAGALLHNDRIYTVHAGDCRVGKVTSQGIIDWLTIDHVPAYQQYLAGEIFKGTRSVIKEYSKLRRYNKQRYKRKTGFEKLLDFSVYLPWWLSFLIAMVTFFLFDYLSSGTPEMTFDSRREARQLIRSVRWDTIFFYLKYILPIAFCMGALLNLIIRKKL